MQKYILSSFFLSTLYAFELCCCCAEPADCFPEYTETCCDGPSSMRVSLQHRESKGIGYNKGYSSLDLFFAPCEPWCWGLGFLDFRGHVFNDGKFAANAGFGWRYLSDNWCSIFGFNAYYDYRKSHHHNYNQICFGFEMLRSCWEFRANGYIPLGKKTHTFSSGREESAFRFSRFAGNQIILQQTINEKRKSQQAMSGVTTELGRYLVADCNFDLYFGAGPYYFKGPHGKAAVGAQARLTANVSKLITIEVSDSWDTVFHNRPQLLISLNIPLGPKAKISRDCCSSFSLEERLYQPVQRQEIIVLDTRKKTNNSVVQEVAINPVTDLPFFVIFVDNTSSSLGTFESPFPTLAQAQAASAPHDLIYVFPGDGTTTGMDAGIVLKDNQQLLGAGLSKTLLTTKGLITIPPHASGYPLITNTGGSGFAVTLANSNTVSGIHITNPIAEAIVGIGISNAVIENNIITVNDTFTGTFEGIDLRGPGMLGEFLIQNNSILHTNLFFSMNGMVLTPDGNDVCTLNVIGNQVTVHGNGVEIETLGNSTVQANVLNNTLTSTKPDKALFLEPKNTSTLTYLVQGNTCRATAPGGNNAGLLIQGHDSSFSSGLVTSNKFLDSENGFEFKSETGGANTVRMMADIQNNQFSNNSSIDFRAQISASKAGILCFGLSGNVATSTAPTFNYELQLDNNSAVMNLNYFINNTGTLGSTGLFPFTTFPTCP